jgi:glycopeptide antibiotics resistance protein
MPIDPSVMPANLRRRHIVRQQRPVTRIVLVVEFVITLLLLIIGSVETAWAPPSGYDSLLHMAAYAALMFPFALCVRDLVQLGVASSFCILFGVLMELMQYLTIVRQPDISDVAANCVGIGLMASLGMFRLARQPVVKRSGRYYF